MAWIPTFDEKTVAMRRDSTFLHELNATTPEHPYELFCYVRLNDSVVGAENAAPKGRWPWWVANVPFDFSHLGAGEDPRILVDIARRLRNEPPFATVPAAPLPGTREEEASGVDADQAPESAS